MSVAIPIPLLQNLPDVNVSLAVGVDENMLVYDHDTARFVLRAPVVNAVTPGLRHSVYCLGDSLTETVTYPAKLQALLGSTWEVHNAGFSGNETSQMLSRVTPVCLTPGDGEYIVVLGGINDVVHDIAAATIESNLQAIYTAAHNAGLKVVAVTITPFEANVNHTAPLQAVLDAVNAWIVATASNVDYTIDAYTLLEDPADADHLLAAYDSGDHLHLSTAGYEAMATAIYNAVTWTVTTLAVNLYVAGDVSLNQSLLTTAPVAFKSVYANDLAAEVSVSAFDVITGHVFPKVDSTMAFQIQKADSLTNVLTVDTVNSRVKIGPTLGAPPYYTLEVNGDAKVGDLLVASVAHVPYMFLNNAMPGYSSYIQFQRAGVTTWYVGVGVTANADQFEIYSITKNGPLLKLLSAGLVGVNDPAPAEALDVTGNINTTGVVKVDDVQVLSNRVIDARAADTANSGDVTTDGLIDALRDAMVAHGLIAASA